MTLDYLLSFKHEIDGNYILFVRRRECAAPYNITLPVVDERYCPYCGSARTSFAGDLVKEGGWYYSSYECGVEVALYSRMGSNMCSIVAISLPIICSGADQDDTI